MEGLVFYSSQTVKEYKTLLMDQIRELLLNFPKFIAKFTDKVLNSLKIISKMSRYATVHGGNQKEIGHLFHLLPKIRYCVGWDCNSIVHIDDYLPYNISPEELRYIDYTMNLKTKRHSQPLLSPVGSVLAFQNGFTFQTVKLNASVIEIQHTLPIVYPYTEEAVFGQKYPTFWQKVVEDDALFTCVPIEKDNDEYTFVSRLFHRTLPSSIVIIAIERIQNRHLFEKFSSHRAYMKKKNKNVLNEEFFFHGTDSDNHHRIIAHGFNRSYCKDTTIYGRGVYFARHAVYSHMYADGGSTLGSNDFSSLILCRVLVGHHSLGRADIRTPPMITLNNSTQSIQADSTTDNKTPYEIVCTFHDDQNYPEYIISYTSGRSHT